MLEKNYWKLTKSGIFLYIGTKKISGFLRRWGSGLLLSAFKIALCVIEGDVLYNLSKPFYVIWNFSILCPGSDEVAEYASEVLMSGIGKEGAAICKHSDEGRE